MTQFDDLLRAAFDAGVSRAESEAIWTNLDNGVYVGETPDFDEWRASLSGLKAAPSEPPFQYGDFAYVCSDDRTFKEIYGVRVQIKSRGWMDVPSFVILVPGDGEWLIPASGLRR